MATCQGASEQGARWGSQAGDSAAWEPAGATPHPGQNRQRAMLPLPWEQVGRTLCLYLEAKCIVCLGPAASPHPSPAGHSRRGWSWAAIGLRAPGPDLPTCRSGQGHSQTAHTAVQSRDKGRGCRAGQGHKRGSKMRGGEACASRAAQGAQFCSAQSRMHI